MPRRLLPSPAAAAMAIVAAAGLVSAVSRGASADPLRVGDAVLEPVALRDLPGWAEDDAGAALDAFRLACAAPAPGPAPRVPQPAGVAGVPADLAAACTAAGSVSSAGARAFFETRFRAYRVVRPATADAPERRTGFLTGYFEPELIGALAPGPAFATPVLARPDDLVSFAPGETGPALDPALRAAQRTAAGLIPYPDRAAIEDGALGAAARPILWLSDAVDLLVLQVQGSGRVRLPDGRGVRVLYDGKNGRPYTAVGKLIVAEGHLPLDGLTLARWTGWLRAHPDDARRLIRANASYVFFRLEPIADPRLGPPGAAGAPLSPGRSLAVDAALWRYGLPFWLEGRVAGAPAPGRLAIAGDTGSAIVGPARGDLYLGTGAAAGAAAGDLRAGPGFVVLLPKPADGETTAAVAGAGP